MPRSLLQPATRLVILICLVLLVGCSTTQQDIDVWADSVGGEDRIAAVISDPSAEMPIRSYAMVKMIRLRDFTRLNGALVGLEKQDLDALINASAEEIGNLLTFPDITVQAAAKDALYLFLKIDNQLVAKSARQALLLWYKTDFEKKFAQGKFSAFHVLTELGPECGELLVAVAKTEPAVRPKVAKIAEAINNPELNSTFDSLYAEWFKPAENPELAAEALSLACYVRGPAFTEQLNQFVQDSANSYQMRRKAMNTLTYHPSESSLPMAQAIIANSKETGDMRGLALEILEKLGKPDAAPALLPLINDDNVRWFAFKAAVKLGGVQQIAPMLNLLKPGAKLWREDYDFAADVIVKSGAEAADAIAPFLKSKDVNVVAIALLALEKLKAKQHVDVINAFTGDKREIPRYESKKALTIGALAARVVKEMK